LPQGFGSLLQFEVAQILLHDGRHGHAQRCSEVLRSHFALPLGVCEQLDQAPRKILRISRLIKIEREFLPGCHLPEVGNVRGDDGHTVGAGQVCDTAASGG
jgi:hypothetical protein